MPPRDLPTAFVRGVAQTKVDDLPLDSHRIENLVVPLEIETTQERTSGGNTEGRPRDERITTRDDRNSIGPNTDPKGHFYRARRTLRTAWRFLVICYRLLPLLIAYVRDQRRFVLVGGSRRPTAKTRRWRARYLRKAFVDLGPTFVKLGQLLSTRPDAVPSEYVSVLSTLQDQVPTADWHAIEEVIEREIGSVEETFDSFDPDPISGASLGQVYVATLDGERVAVKVLRPGVRSQVAIDLRVLRTLLSLWGQFAPPAQARAFRRVFEELETTLDEEMDFEHEAAMLEKIGSNAQAEDVVIPAVVEHLSTSRVLTMEYVPGTKVTDVATLEEIGIDRSALARRILSIYTDMVLIDGVFQADPHPGNVAVQPDGSVVLYDFGMCGHLERETRTHLGTFYAGLGAGDLDAVVECFESLGAIAPDADPEELRDLLETAIYDVVGKNSDERDLEDVLENIDLYRFPLVLPRELALLVRLGTVLEGVLRTVDPDIDVISEFGQYGQG